MGTLLLCGGTGVLGGRIATLLAGRGVRVRVMVRAGSDESALRALGAEIVTGDLTDPASLDRAVTDAGTVVSTANAIGRLLAGRARGLTLDAVDRVGNLALVRAAETAGVERFVFVSMSGLSAAMVARSPFAAAKRQTERALAASPMPSVVVRPSRFQETWLSPRTGIHPDRRLAVVYGRGRTPERLVAVGDVAEACVRLALAGDPPSTVEVGGSEALTRHQVVDGFERETGTRFRRIRVPRPALAAGSRALRRAKPELASILGMALTADEEDDGVGPDALRRLGIEPRTTSQAISDLVRERVAADG
ncbi:NAD(P)H-binding protein [Geodermatophilus sabuli]|uniref:NAD(P)H-binding protein n=1 Tax=Geodermatophilus sabuli TaxID=1564158 RepID=A0A7K3VY29_9ACTN|nr:NAD(P)H-binding protein [Geodermatophilus sabuli]NEK57013.1 NAD(P)H-binding protein [Geodermatophilus sabuli]